MKSRVTSRLLLMHRHEVNKSRAKRGLAAALNKLGASKTPMPSVTPMLATKISAPFDHPEWLFEIKWDGYRILACKNKAHVTLLSRKSQDYTETYSAISEALEGLPGSMILDGEMVMLDDAGKPSFDDLQQVRTRGQERLLYCVFDLLWYEGYSLLSVPLLERKKVLAKIIPDKAAHITNWPYREGDGKALFAEMAEQGLEGIVAKRKDSLYLPGKRVDTWLKITTHIRQEFVIGGWTESDAAGRPFRAILFGYYDAEGRLIWYGHSGGGYSDKEAAALRREFDKLELKAKPFVNEVDTDAKPHWVKPVLVGEFQYATTTKSGRIRKPAIFKGLRADKDPQDVHLEIARDGGATKVALQPQVSRTSVKPKSTSKAKEERSDSNWPEVLRFQHGLSKTKLDVDGQVVTLHGLERMIWSDAGITKAKLIQYYIESAQYILPYLQDRPLSLHVKPYGPTRPGLYIKGMEGHQPEWARVYETQRKHKARGKPDVIDYLVCNDRATLVYLIDLGCIDVNPWSSRTTTPLNPDYLVIDIDPMGGDFSDVVEAALAAKRVLDKLKLKALPKTSGKTGLHVFIPVEPVFTFPQARSLVAAICRLIHEAVPGITTIEDTVADRGGKVFLDDNQNDETDTVAAAYSVRPYHLPLVSTPLEWREVNKRLDPEAFQISTIRGRLRKKGDLFKDLFDNKTRRANTRLLKTLLDDSA
jgi:bifunctional non-homologous end joining protein LigD